MHFFPYLCLILFCSLLFNAAPVKADNYDHGDGLTRTEPNRLAAAQPPSSITEIIRNSGIVVPSRCEPFTKQTLIARQSQWKTAIDEISKHYPDELMSWLIGAKRPNAAIMKEAEFQKNCLLSALVDQSAQTNGRMRLFLDFDAAFDGEFESMSDVIHRFQKSAQWRRKILSYLSRSSYRDSNSQAYIWRRKILFQGRSFNIISDDAAKRCNLTAGHTWKPDNSRHQQCWFHELREGEREREMLAASSAPGLSRHHWGTDFDILSLNPYHFSERGTLGSAYRWLHDNAITYGFFQPFHGPQFPRQLAYIEERWHWSYDPIASVFLDYIEANTVAFSNAINTQWDNYEVRWSGQNAVNAPSYFGFIRRHWKEYVLVISKPDIHSFPEDEKVDDGRSD